jgi:hypothetical protein
MTSATLEHELVAALERVGIRSGRIDMPASWPALKSWWRAPLSDWSPDDEQRLFYLALRPAVARQTGTVFAGMPPSVIADGDLVCLDFERKSVRRSERAIVVEQAVALCLWCPAHAAWEQLRLEAGWIDLGPSTPSLDWFAEGRHSDELVSAFERSAVFEIASRQRPLALEVVGAGFEHLVLMADDAVAE